MTTHKLAFVSVLGLALAGATATSAHADARKSYRTDKSFGLGLMVGAPTGLSGKYHLDAPIAIAFGLGTSHYGHHEYDGRRGYYHNHGTQLHADVLWHPTVLVSNRTFQMPLHVGVGAQVRSHDHDYDRNYDDHSHIGVRVPFGITMDFERVPMDAFFELAYALDFTGPDNHSYIAGSLGARYYF